MGSMLGEPFVKFPATPRMMSVAVRGAKAIWQAHASKAYWKQAVESQSDKRVKRLPRNDNSATLVLNSEA